MYLRSVVLIGVVLFVAPTLLAQSDDFDSYAPGSFIAGQGPWETWDLTPGFDAQVSSLFANSAPNSLELQPFDDIVQTFSGLDSGIHSFRANVYVPSGQAGIYMFIMLNTYAVAPGPKNWSVQIEINDVTGLVTDLGGSSPVTGTSTPVSVVYDSWVPIEVVVDVNADVYFAFYNYQIIMNSNTWSGTTGLVEVQCLDLYNNGGGNCYFDDVFVPTPFIRGDANQDGVVTVTDLVPVAQAVLNPGCASADCMMALDFEPDGFLDPIDMFFLAQFLTTGFSSPPPPYPLCGYSEGFFLGVDCLSYDCTPPAPPLSLDSVLSATSATVNPGEFADVDVLIDTTVDLAAYTFGICHDSALFSISSVDPGLDSAGFEFNLIDVDTDGWRVAALVFVFGIGALPAGTGLHLYDAVYESLGPEGSTDLTFCESTGALSVVIEVATADCPSITATPTVQSGQLTVEIEPLFEIIAPDLGPFPYPSGDGLTGLTVPAEFAISELDVGGPSPLQTQGFSVVCVSDAALVTPVSLTLSDVLTTAIDAGGGPSFVGQDLQPGGWNLSVVYNLLGGVFFEFDLAGTPICTVEYAGVAGALLGQVGETVVPLSMESNPPIFPSIPNEVFVNGGPQPLSLQSGSLTFSGIAGTPYVRGDCNADGPVNIADAIALLGILFTGGSTTCTDACNANGDVGFDIADAIYILGFLFSNGPAPASPFPDCGVDENLGCDTYNCPKL